MPEVRRVIRVRLALAIIAVKFIPALLNGIAFGARRTEAPFAEHTGGVAGLLQQLRNGDEAGGNRPLAFWFYLSVTANK